MCPDALVGVLVSQKGFYDWPAELLYRGLVFLQKLPVVLVNGSHAHVDEESEVGLVLEKLEDFLNDGSELGVLEILLKNQIANQHLLDRLEGVKLFWILLQLLEDEVVQSIVSAVVVPSK